jgi:hypothetical protein
VVERNASINMIRGREGGGGAAAFQIC